MTHRALTFAAALCVGLLCAGARAADAPAMTPLPAPAPESAPAPVPDVVCWGGSPFQELCGKENLGTLLAGKFPATFVERFPAGKYEVVIQLFAQGLTPQDGSAGQGPFLIFAVAGVALQTGDARHNFVPFRVFTSSWTGTIQPPEAQARELANGVMLAAVKRMLTRCEQTAGCNLINE